MFYSILIPFLLDEVKYKKHVLILYFFSKVFTIGSKYYFIYQLFTDSLILPSAGCLSFCASPFGNILSC